jgi:hypothetical protein
MKLLVKGKAVWSDSDFEALLTAADTNGDGQIQYEEFTNWLLADDDDWGRILERGDWCRWRGN